MDASEAAYQRSRQLTDELKYEIRMMVESWIERSDIRNDPHAFIAALGETTAEVGISFASPTITVGFLLQLAARSEEHTSELQSLMRISYAVLCLKKNHIHITAANNQHTINTY